MNKNALISGLIFGIIFLALGVFLFTLRGESTLILIIAIADLLFGLALAASGLVSLRRRKPAADIAAPRSSRRSEAQERPAAVQPQYQYRDVHADEPRAEAAADMPDMTAPAQDRFDELDTAPEKEPDLGSMTPAEIKAEELRLREEVHRSSAEAKQAIDDAKAAVAQAEADERALSAAEEESRRLTGAAQQNALRHVDRLAQQATASSNRAAAAKQKARAARDEARRIAELHSKAVEAAAGSMDDDF